MEEILLKQGSVAKRAELWKYCELAQLLGRPIKVKKKAEGKHEGDDGEESVNLVENFVRNPRDGRTLKDY